MRATRSLVRGVSPFLISATTAIAPGCSCDAPPAALVAPIGICTPRHDAFAIAAPLQSKHIEPGNVPVDFHAGGDGTVDVSISLVNTGLRDPDLRVTYDGQNEGPLGVGFRLAGPSVIQRCNKTVALGGKQRGT